MKIVLISLFLLQFYVLWGQKIEVNESKEKLSVGNVNCLVVNIPYGSKDDIENAWKKLMKKANAKVSGKSEIFADNASFPDISPNTIDFYFRLDELKKDEGYKAIVGLDLGGAFLNSKDHPAGYEAAKKMLKNFATDIAEKAIENQVKDQERVVSKLKNQQNDLDKENKKLQKEIEECESTIQKNKDKISQNQHEMKDLDSKIGKETEKLNDLREKMNKLK
jgi:valyl-tRNA synthetase